MWYLVLLLLSHFSRVRLCDPIDGSPPGSPVPGILQAKTLEWVAISFSNEWKWKVKVKSFSHFWLLATLWTIAYQAPLSMGFSRQENWVAMPSSRESSQSSNRSWASCTEGRFFTIWAMPDSGLCPRIIYIYLIFIFTLFYFTILYRFCYTLTWIHHGCTCIQVMFLLRWRILRWIQRNILIKEKKICLTNCIIKRVSRFECQEKT